MINKINKLQKILDVKFKNTDLLTQAITHKSYNSQINYEILEFLGDRILALTISRKLIDLYPDEKVGILDKRFSNLVNKNTCYKIGMSLQLNEFVLIGNSKKKIMNIENKIISDVCESIIGAIYLDKNFPITRDELVKRLESKNIETRNAFVPINKQKILIKKYNLFKENDCPNANYIMENGFYLPSGNNIKNEEIDFVCSEIKKQSKFN